MEVRQYQAIDGHTPIRDWLHAFRDAVTRARIVARLDRLEAGSRGDWRSVGQGVFELRIDSGPGYRVCYGHDGAAVILLLCGGDKHTQVRDIEKAHAYWKDYQARSR